MADEKDSFENRLRAAESKRAGPALTPAQGGNASPMGIGVRVGAELVAALAVGLAIGWGLDRLFGTMPLFLALFVLLGGAAGVANVWRLMMPRAPRQ